MRSSYYSDRRFKRSSLAHELCSKIEVTPGPELRSQRELPPNLYFSFIPLHCLSLLFARSPILIPSRLDPSSFPANAMILCLSIAPTRPWYLAESSLFAFVSTIYFLFASGEIGRSVGRSASPWSSSSFFHLSLFRLAPKRCPSTASWLPTSRHNRSPREFVDYNKCVCSSRRYRTSSGSPVFFFFLFFPSSLSVVFSLARAFPFRPSSRFSLLLLERAASPSRSYRRAHSACNRGFRYTPLGRTTAPMA